MPSALPEVWLRGPIEGFPPELMPVAQSLLQVLEEVDRVVRPLTFEELWIRPGGAASIGFHLKHLAGSLDRLLTYARGERLSDGQRSALDAEEIAGLANDQPALLLHAASEAIARALQQVLATGVETLNQPRRVGRAGLPSTVRGLLFHSAEHAQRHAGQIVTTAKIVCGSRGPDQTS
ncbi:MAG: DinB family protein [Acidobacteriota bacterium]